MSKKVILNTEGYNSLIKEMSKFKKNKELNSSPILKKLLLFEGEESSKIQNKTRKVVAGEVASLDNEKAEEAAKKVIEKMYEVGAINSIEGEEAKKIKSLTHLLINKDVKDLATKKIEWDRLFKNAGDGITVLVNELQRLIRFPCDDREMMAFMIKFYAYALNDPTPDKFFVKVLAAIFEEQNETWAEFLAKFGFELASSAIIGFLTGTGPIPVGIVLLKTIKESVTEVGGEVAEDISRDIASQIGGQRGLRNKPEMAVRRQMDNIAGTAGGKRTGTLSIRRALAIDFADSAWLSETIEKFTKLILDTGGAALTPRVIAEDLFNHTKKKLRAMLAADPNNPNLKRLLKDLDDPKIANEIIEKMEKEVKAIRDRVDDILIDADISKDQFNFLVSGQKRLSKKHGMMTRVTTRFSDVATGRWRNMIKELDPNASVFDRLRWTFTYIFGDVPDELLPRLRDIAEKLKVTRKQRTPQPDVKAKSTKSGTDVIGDADLPGSTSKTKDKYRGKKIEDIYNERLEKEVQKEMEKYDKRGEKLTGGDVQKHTRNRNDYEQNVRARLSNKKIQLDKDGTAKIQKNPDGTYELRTRKEEPDLETDIDESIIEDMVNRSIGDATEKESLLGVAMEAQKKSGIDPSRSGQPGLDVTVGPSNNPTPTPKGSALPRPVSMTTKEKFKKYVMELINILRPNIVVAPGNKKIRHLADIDGAVLANASVAIFLGIGTPARSLRDWLFDDYLKEISGVLDRDLADEDLEAIATMLDGSLIKDGVVDTTNALLGKRPMIADIFQGNIDALSSYDINTISDEPNKDLDPFFLDQFGMPAVIQPKPGENKLDFMLRTGYMLEIPEEDIKSYAKGAGIDASEVITPEMIDQAEDNFNPEFYDALGPTQGPIETGAEQLFVNLGKSVKHQQDNWYPYNMMTLLLGKKADPITWFYTAYNIMSIFDEVVLKGVLNYCANMFRSDGSPDVGILEAISSKERTFTYFLKNSAMFNDIKDRSGSPYQNEIYGEFEGIYYSPLSPYVDVLPSIEIANNVVEAGAATMGSVVAYKNMPNKEVLKLIKRVASKMGPADISTGYSIGVSFMNAISAEQKRQLASRRYGDMNALRKEYFASVKSLGGLNESNNILIKESELRLLINNLIKKKRLIKESANENIDLSKKAGLDKLKKSLLMDLNNETKYQIIDASDWSEHSQIRILQPGEGNASVNYPGVFYEFDVDTYPALGAVGFQIKIVFLGIKILNSGESPDDTNGWEYQLSKALTEEDVNYNVADFKLNITKEDRGTLGVYNELSRSENSTDKVRIIRNNYLFQKPRSILGGSDIPQVNNTINRFNAKISNAVEKFIPNNKSKIENLYAKVKDDPVFNRTIWFPFLEIGIIKEEFGGAMFKSNLAFKHVDASKKRTSGPFRSSDRVAQIEEKKRSSVLIDLTSNVNIYQLFLNKNAVHAKKNNIIWNKKEDLGSLNIPTVELPEGDILPIGGARELRRNFLANTRSGGRRPGVVELNTMRWILPTGKSTTFVPGLNFGMGHNSRIYLMKMYYYLVYCLSAMVYKDGVKTEEAMESESNIFKFGWLEGYKKEFNYTGGENDVGVISDKLTSLEDIEEALKLITEWAFRNNVGPYKSGKLPVFDGSVSIEDWVESIPKEYAGFRTSVWWAGISNLLREILLDRDLDDRYSNARTSFNSIFENKSFKSWLHEAKIESLSDIRKTIERSDEKIPYKKQFINLIKASEKKQPKSKTYPALAFSILSDKNTKDKDKSAMFAALNNIWNEMKDSHEYIRKLYNDYVSNKKTPNMLKNETILKQKIDKKFPPK